MLVFCIVIGIISRGGVRMTKNLIFCLEKQNMFKFVLGNQCRNL